MSHTVPSSGPGWLWLAALVPAGAVATAIVLLGLGYVFNASGESVEVSPAERALLPTVTALAPWLGAHRPDGRWASVAKTRFADGTWELRYTYEAADDPRAPFVSYSVTFEPSEALARTTFWSQRGGTAAAFLFEEEGIVFTLEELPGGYRWGDASRADIVRADGAAFGNVFIARRGAMVVYLLLTGPGLEDDRALRALLEPCLEALSKAASAR